uniref:Uncharacterized protein n=1 Tax=Anopheles atroparvus TaxID=41427 RepID=A0A182J3H8_ANOAO
MQSPQNGRTRYMVKNGSQQKMNPPTMMPSVLAAFVSMRKRFTCTFRCFLPSFLDEFGERSRDTPTGASLNTLLRRLLICCDICSPLATDTWCGLTGTTLPLDAREIEICGLAGPSPPTLLSGPLPLPRGPLPPPASARPGPPVWLRPEPPAPPPLPITTDEPSSDIRTAFCARIVDSISEATPLPRCIRSVKLSSRFFLPPTINSGPDVGNGTIGTVRREPGESEVEKCGTINRPIAAGSGGFSVMDKEKL